MRRYRVRPQRVAAVCSERSAACSAGNEAIAMSRAFVKESDGDAAAEQLPDLPLSPNPNFVTPQGLDQLKSRQAALELQRTQLETEEDLAARQRLPEVRRDLRYLSARIARAILVTPRS